MKVRSFAAWEVCFSAIFTNHDGIKSSSSCSKPHIANVISTSVSDMPRCLAHDGGLSADSFVVEGLLPGASVVLGLVCWDAIKAWIKIIRSCCDWVCWVGAL